MLTWLFGCWHDWEEVESIKTDHLRSRLQKHDARWIPPGQNSEQRLVRKVCLTCGIVVDQIAEATEQFEAARREAESRQKLARTMLDMPPAKPHQFSERPPLPPPPPPKRYA